MAALQGHAIAQCALAYAYYNGDEGVAQSDDMAREWWFKAALQEDEDAIENLDLLDQEEGKTTPTLPRCAFCSRPESTALPLKKCQQCHTARYCNRECQMTHWKAGHKRECKQQKEHQKKEAAQGGGEK